MSRIYFLKIFRYKMWIRLGQIFHLNWVGRSFNTVYKITTCSFSIWKIHILFYSIKTIEGNSISKTCVFLVLLKNIYASQILRDIFLDGIGRTFFNSVKKKKNSIQLGIKTNCELFVSLIIISQGDLKINWFNIYILGHFFLLKWPSVIHHIYIYMVVFIFIYTFIANACRCDHHGPVNIY
jgi:hypothetical protein